MEIRIKRERGPRPTKRPPPGSRPFTAIVDPGVYTPEVSPVYLTRDARQVMLRHAISGGACEVGGFLLGGYHIHKGERFVDIDVAVPALSARGAGISLTFDNQTLREFHEERSARYPEKEVLGWYHTHPRHSVFLSDHDTFIHRSFFNLEHHVAIVLDPYEEHAADRIGLFKWEEGALSQGYHPIVYEAEQ